MSRDDQPAQAGAHESSSRGRRSVNEIPRPGPTPSGPETLNNADLRQILFWFWPFHFKALNATDNGVGDKVIAIPIAVGRDEMPGGRFVTGGIKHVFISLHVIIPMLASGEVGLGKFPIFTW